MSVVREVSDPGRPSVRPVRLAPAALTALALAVASGPARAEAEPPEGVATRAAAAPEAVVVSASRLPVPANRTGASVTRIEAPALARASGPLLADRLAGEPGVTVSRNGGPGGYTAVRLRGAEGEHTLVLVDGMKLSDAAAPGGGFDFAHMAIAGIERVEILRGPQSAMHGSEALGGVVSIETLRPGGPARLRLSAEAGGRGARTHHAAWQGRLLGSDWAVSNWRARTDGVSALAPSSGGRELDFHEVDGLRLRWSAPLADGVRLEAAGHSVRAESGIDGFPPPLYAFADTPDRTRTRERALRAGLALGMPGGAWSGGIHAGTSRIARQTLDPAASLPLYFDSEGRIDRLEALGVWRPSAAASLMFGLDREAARQAVRHPSSFDPDPAFARAGAITVSGFAEWRAETESGAAWTLGGRVSDHESFGSVATGRATLALPFAGNLLRLSVGDGFKAPTLFQLYSEYGNAVLRPERSRSAEIGFERRFPWADTRLSATAHARDTTDQIDYISCFGSSQAICAGRPFGTYDNIKRASARGVEASASLQPLDALRVEASLGFLRARNRSDGALSGRALARRPDTTAALSWIWTPDAATEIAVRHVWNGRSWDDAANTIAIPAWSLTGVSVSRRVGAARFGVRIDNLFDQDAATAHLYSGPPRQILFAISWDGEAGGR